MKDTIDLISIHEMNKSIEPFQFASKVQDENFVNFTTINGKLKKYKMNKGNKM